MNVTPIVYEYVIICEFINCKRRKIPIPIKFPISYL